MAILKTVRWILNLLLFIYRKIGVPLVMLCLQTSNPLQKVIVYSMIISAPINLRYYKSEHLSYIELSRKGIKEKSIEGFLIFLARTLEIIGYTALSGQMVSRVYKENDDIANFFVVFLLNVFGVLKPAVLGYDAPQAQAPRVVKHLPKTVSHLSLRQPAKQKSQQSPGLPECDQKKRVLTQKVLLNPQCPTKGYTARLA